MEVEVLNDGEVHVFTDDALMGGDTSEASIITLGGRRVFVHTGSFGRVNRADIRAALFNSGVY